MHELPYLHFGPKPATLDFQDEDEHKFRALYVAMVVKLPVPVISDYSLHNGKGKQSFMNSGSMLVAALIRIRKSFHKTFLASKFD